LAKYIEGEHHLILVSYDMVDHTSTFGSTDAFRKFI